MPNHCLDELERLECNVVPADILDYAEKHVGSILLDSVSQGYGFGRYSIFACSPRKEILAHRDRIEIITTEGSEIRRGDPLESLRFELGNPSNEVFPKREIPLLGGALGYFAYDFGRRLRKPSLGFDKVRESPDMRFYLYDAVLVWDHLSEELFLARDSREEGAERTSEFLKSILRDCRSGDKTGVFEVGPLASNISRQDFLENVESVRRLILEGEIYQANLSRGYSASFQGSSAALYRRLRMENPAPYSAYMNFGDEIILSTSPERFLHCRDRVANTRPIKGTRPRGRSIEEQVRLENDLAGSEKDRAELLMIVDLERNDLGRVCEIGSIRVDNLFALESYASVIHQTASVSGRLANGMDAFDCIGAMFPGGSITGAPKIRAMEALNAIETEWRGIYTGSIGYLGRDGEADFNIAIRTLRICENRVAFNVGGGIVWDSTPESEYEETLHKAKAILKALGKI
jgi:para-aminobenzoate synthetase component 1